jgi:hypothetical protein
VRLGELIGPQQGQGLLWGVGHDLSAPDEVHHTSLSALTATLDQLWRRGRSREETNRLTFLNADESADLVAAVRSPARAIGQVCC